MTAVITSKTNARVKALRAAATGSRRSSDGLVAIEGPNLLAEAIHSHMPLHSIYVREDAIELLRTLKMDAETEPIVLSRDVFNGAVATESSQGIAALVRPAMQTLSLTDNPLLLVLVGLQDPGNMGTLLRSAEAFGADAVVVTPGTVDAWNQKAIRASAGSIFRMPVVEMELSALKQTGVRLTAAVARDGNSPDQTNFLGPCAIVIGNEGSGLDAASLRLMDNVVTIPCPGTVESLNAATAGSLLLYEASKQRCAL